jgi:hypothetical protein
VFSVITPDLVNNRRSNEAKNEKYEQTLLDKATVLKTKAIHSRLPQERSLKHNAFSVIGALLKGGKGQTGLEYL